MANASSNRLVILFSTLLVSAASFSQSGRVNKITRDSALCHKWAVTVIGKKVELNDSKKKILAFDAFPPELPNTIDFFNNGTVSVGYKKGTWETTRSKRKLKIVLDGKSTSYRINQGQYDQVRFHEIGGRKEILLLKKLD